MNEIRIYSFQKQFVAIFNVFFYKSLDGVLGIRTRGRRMVGTDETTELWRPPRYL